MDCSLKYVFVIFVIVYILTNFLLNDNSKDRNNKKKDIKENFSIELDDLISNPNKAGSIDITDVYDPPKQDFYKFITSDNLFRKNEYSEQKYFETIRVPQPGDYKPYETILPSNFQVPQVKYVDTRKIIGVSKIEDEFKEIDYKIDVPQNVLRDPKNDCQGEWTQWNTDNCRDPNKRCSLKYRTYRIIKQKRENGLRCEYNGQRIDDGDIEYGYCYGGNNNERCGVSQNVCECNIDDPNSEDSNCDVELNNMCVCPDDMEINEQGKCVLQEPESDPDDPAPDDPEPDDPAPDDPDLEELNNLCKTTSPNNDNIMNRNYIDYSMKMEFDCVRGMKSQNGKDSINCINGEWESLNNICNVCDQNFHVQSNKCVKCPPSNIIHPSGDNPLGENTLCSTQSTPPSTPPAPPSTPPAPPSTPPAPPSTPPTPPPTPSTPPAPPSTPPTSPPPPYRPRTNEEIRHDESLKETIRKYYIYLFILVFVLVVGVFTLFL